MDTEEKTDTIRVELNGQPPRQATDEVMQELDETKAQVIWNKDTCIVVIPTDKITRPFARGLLREAEDMVCIHYAQAAQKKRMILEPSHNLRNKLAKLSPFR